MKVQRKLLKITDEYSDNYIPVKINQLEKRVEISVIQSPDKNEIYKLYEKKSKIIGNTVIMRFENFFDIVYNFIYNNKKNEIFSMLDSLSYREIDDYGLPETFKVIKEFKNNRNKSYRNTRKQAFIDMSFNAITNDIEMLNEFMNFYYQGVSIKFDNETPFICIKDKNINKFTCTKKKE